MTVQEIKYKHANVGGADRLPTEMHTTEAGRANAELVNDTPRHLDGALSAWRVPDNGICS